MFAGTLLSELDLSSLCWDSQREADDDGRDHHHDSQHPEPAPLLLRSAATARRPATRKAPAKTTARRARTTAKRETATAAEANNRAAQATARQGAVVAERATLIGVGATLEARDRVVEFVTDWYETFAAPLTSRELAEKQLRKFERRGTTERNRLERRAQEAPARASSASSRAAAAARPSHAGEKVVRSASPRGLV